MYHLTSVNSFVLSQDKNILYHTRVAICIQRHSIFNGLHKSLATTKAHIYSHWTCQKHLDREYKLSFPPQVKRDQALTISLYRMAKQNFVIAVHNQDIIQNLGKFTKHRILVKNRKNTPMSSISISMDKISPIIDCFPL